MHLVADHPEDAVRLPHRVVRPVVAGEVVGERAVLHVQRRLLLDQHENGGAGVHRHVVAEDAVFDDQPPVGPDECDGPLVVDEAAAGDNHVRL